MWLERISGGGVDLIDLQDAKDYLRITGTEADDDVAAAVAAASAYLDVDDDGFGGLGFPLVSQQWVLRGKSFGAQVLRLPFARIMSVDEIRFMPPSGQSETVAVENYQLVKRGREWCVTLLAGCRWPQVADRPDAVEVRFTSGWSSVEFVPRDIKAAARLLVEFYFETRALSDGPDIPARVSAAVDSLTQRYRRFAA